MPPSLRFTPTAWAKLLFLRDYGETEVGAFGIAAIDDLLAKSSQVADLSGVELGQLVYIIESGGPAQVQFASERAFAASAMANPTPILAGELNVVVTMQAIFEIQRSGS